MGSLNKTLCPFISIQIHVSEVLYQSSTYRRQPFRFFPACTPPSWPRSWWASLRATPLPFLSRGPHQQLHRLLFPVQLTSLPLTPPPCGPRCQRRLLRDSQRLPSSPGHHCRPITIWHSLSCHVCHRGARLNARWPGQGWWQGGL